MGINIILVLTEQPIQDIKPIDGKVDSFSSSGVFLDQVSISIDGASNTTIPYGASFIPMARITLNAPADPTAKIEVSGTVNTKTPGTYKLTYTVKDAYGQTATREITVKPMSDYGNYEISYVTAYGCVLNANVNLGNISIPKNTEKTVIIKNSAGKVIYTLPTVDVNWYSSSKNNYSGFQCIIENELMRNLKLNDGYTVFVKLTTYGKTYEVPVINHKKLLLTTDKPIKYNIGFNDNNILTLTRIPTNMTKGIAKLEQGYWESYGYVMNLGFNIGVNILKGTKAELVGENEADQIVSVTPGVDINWFSNSTSDYTYIIIFLKLP